ncbi:MAG: hypothetical protein HKN37_16425 [Rhodothermales bacterium]|nr:hypothetical protein [Rhodothermales bacterium]
MEEFNPNYEEIVNVINQKHPEILEWAIMAVRSAKMEAWIQSEREPSNGSEEKDSSDTD